MRVHVSLDAWCARLLTALALVPVAGCDDTVDSSGTLIACEAPQPQIPGADTGYEVCQGGWLHRPEATACPSQLPRAGTTCMPGGLMDECTTDAECTASPNGYCQGQQEGCGCSYGCTTDAECGDGRICLCGDAIGRCVAASCGTDADCGDGLCSTYVTNPDCGDTAFACQTIQDECASDQDCDGGQGRCSLVGGHRACVQPDCAIGRPFLIDGAERLADAVARDDWRAGGVAPRLDGLTLEDREALAAHWTRAGRMEHASIAAFARFSLQLLQLGAPPALLRDTHAAMADETAHAELCFALASAYAGRGVGPGPLSLDGALAGSDPASVLVTAIREGCVGETVAAIEAAEAARHAVDPVVRGALERIAEDETRHAELAWRFVQWAIDGDPALRAVAAAEIEAVAAEARAPAPAGPSDDDRLLAHGAVGEPLRRAIRRHALARVVGPCARALLASAARAGERAPSHHAAALGGQS